MNTSETLNRTIREVQHEMATANKPSYRDDERLGEALSVMIIELADARAACARMAEKQDDDGMRLYHEGQADAYLMVKRGVEKQLAKLPQAEDCRSVGPF